MRLGDRVKYVGRNTLYHRQSGGGVGTVLSFIELITEVEPWASVRWDNDHVYSYPIRDLCSEHPRMEETVFDLEDIELAEMIIGEMK